MTLPDTPTPDPGITEPATDPAEATAPEPEPDEPDDPDEPDEGREAASYRRRLRATSAERDALAGQVDVLRRRDVERLAESMDGPSLAQGSDLWLTGATVAELLTEDGDVDLDRVAAAVSTALAGRPHWQARGAPRPDLSQGARDTSTPGATMHDLLRRGGR